MMKWASREGKHPHQCSISEFPVCITVGTPCPFPKIHAFGRIVPIICMGVSVKLNSKLKMEMLSESNVPKDLFSLIVWNINECNENTRFFHLTGRTGLFKTRHLSYALNILINIVTFREENGRLWISPMLWLMGLFWLRSSCRNSAWQSPVWKVLKTGRGFSGLSLIYIPHFWNRYKNNYLHLKANILQVADDSG